MGRITALVLCLCLLFSLAGCGSQSGEQDTLFYYRRAETAYGTDQGILVPEPRDLFPMGNDLDGILALYFKGPETIGLESPFPRDTRVVSWTLEGTTLCLTMNEGFAALSGVELTLACSCITKTLIPLTGASAVRFEAESGLLGSEKSLTLSENLIRLTDDSLDQAWTEYTVYYTDRQRRYLIGHEISVNMATEDDLIGQLMEALTHPPENSGLFSALPPGTDLLGYAIDDGICTIDFSGEFEYNGWKNAEAQRLTLLSVVNTLTQLDQIHQVEFTVEGNLLVQYLSISINAPLTREEGAIGPVRTGMNEFDTTLYLSNSPDGLLTPVPTRLRQSSGLGDAELVVTALIQHQDHNGFSSPVPGHTKLNRLMTYEGICHIDLTKEFLSQPEKLELAVKSIVASVCALEDVFSVQITVDGQIPEDVDQALFGVLSPQSDWFV